MAYDPDILRARINAALQGSVLDATALARHLGRGPDYVRDFLNGRKSSLKPQELADLEHFLNVPAYHFLGIGISKGTDFLETPRQERPVIAETSAARSSSMEKRFHTPGDSMNLTSFLRILSTREGERGIFKLITTPVNSVVRPWFVEWAVDSFGFLVSEDDMEPMIEPGEIAVVNKQLPLAKNRNVLLMEEGEEPRVTIKRLLSWDRECWHVRQFNRQQDLTLRRDDWPLAYRIVGRVEA